MVKIRLVAILLAFSLIFCCCCATAAGNDDVEKGDDLGGAVKEIEILTSLGLLAIDEPQGEYITRAEFISAVIRIINLPEDIGKLQSGTVFYDVYEESVYASPIRAAYDMGLISGYEGRYFEPDSYIKYEQALKILVCALGYKEMVSLGSTETNTYLTKASELKIGKGVNIEHSSYITKQQMAKLLFNTVHAPLMKQTGYDDKERRYSLEKDITLLSEMDIYDDEGIVTANSEVNLMSDNKLSSGNIMIDSETYLTNKSECGELLGYRVNFYYRENEEQDEKEILYIAVDDSSNVVLYLTNNDIESGNKSQYKYIDEDNKTKKLQISQDAYILYNNKPAYIIENSDFVPKYGSVTLIDNNDNGDFDVVFINDYDIIVTASVSDNVYYDRYDKENKVLLDPDNNDMEFIITDAGGNKKDINYISEWSVLYVYKSFERLKPFYHVKVIKATDSGKVLEVLDGTDEDEKLIRFQVDERGKYIKEFTVSSIVPKSVMDQIKIGANIEFIIGLDGKIVAIKSIAGVFNFGYMISSHSDLKNTQFKIFTEKNKIEIMECASKVKVDGISKTKKEIVEFLNPLMNIYGEVIRYRLNSKGEVIELDTLNQKAEESDGGLNSRTYTGEGQCLTEPRTFGGFISYEVGIPIFMIPDNIDDEKGYSVVSTSSLVSTRQYTGVFGYYNNTKKLRADLLVMKSVGNSISVSNKAFHVSKITKVLDSEGTESYKITLKGYAYQEQQFVVSSDVNFKSFGIEIGDAIKYNVNYLNEINAIEKVFDYSEAVGYYDNMMLESGFKGTFTGTYGIALGKVLNKNDGIVRIDSYNLDLCFDSSMKNAVYKMGEDNNGNPCVVPASYFELVTYADHPEKCSSVFVQISYGRVYTMFIID